MIEVLPKGRKDIGSKWLFDYKTDKQRKIVKFKARLVAQGFTQIRNVDFIRSSSPCLSSTSIQLILAVANQRGQKLVHLDVVQVYIWANLDGEVFMKLPGRCGDMSREVVRVERTLYGLRQSGRQ